MPRLSLTVNGAFAGGRLGLGMGRSPACLDGLSLTHVCWGLIKSTLRPGTCVCERQVTIGCVYVGKAMRAVELVATTW